MPHRFAARARAAAVTVDDVLDYVASSRRKERRRPASQGSRTSDADAAVAGRRVPHSAMRKRIAEHMVESLLHTAPHVTTVFEADMSAVIAHRAGSQG